MRGAPSKIGKDGTTSTWRRRSLEAKLAIWHFTDATISQLRRFVGMKGAHEALPTSMDRLPSVDLPRVLVGASTTAASSSVAHALREVGYVVNTALTGADVLRELRNQKA